MQLALRIAREALGEEHPTTSIIYNNLGGIMSAQHRYDEAELYLRRALDSRRRRLGESSPLTASSYANVGQVLSARRRWREAEPYARLGLAFKLRSAGANNPETAIAHDIIGNILGGQGRWQEAEDHFRRALAVADDRQLGLRADLNLFRFHLAMLWNEAGVRRAESYALRATALSTVIQSGSHSFVDRGDGNIAYRDQFLAQIALGWGLAHAR